MSDYTAEMTNQGWNLLERYRDGLITFNLSGFRVGSGYDPLDPMIPVPSYDASANATGYVEIVNNTFDANDAVIINGVRFEVSVDWNPGVDIPTSVVNLTTAVQNSTNSSIQNIITAVANVNKMELTCTAIGFVGNNLPLIIDDHATENFQLSGTTLLDGYSFRMQSPLFPDVSLPPKPFSLIEKDGKLAVAVYCKLERNEANFGLSEIGIYSTILTSNIPQEIGRTYIFATVAHALRCKDWQSERLDRIKITFNTSTAPTGWGAGPFGSGPYGR